MTDSSSLYNAEKSLLTIQIASLEREKGQLEEQATSHKQEIEHLRLDTINLQKELVKSQNLYEQLKIAHEQDMDTEKKNFQKEKSNHEESMKLLESKLTQESNNKIQSINEEHANAIQLLKKEHKQELENTHNNWESKVQNLEATLRKHQEIESKYQSDIATMSKSMATLQHSLEVYIPRKYVIDTSRL